MEYIPFETPADSGLSHEERGRYEQSLIQYRDLKSALETAVEDKLIENARHGILKGYDNQVIADLTGLNTDEIERIRQERESSLTEHFSQTAGLLMA